MKAWRVFEKFTEESDPIQDMKIGVKHRLEHYPKWMHPEAKDIMRVKDIIKKANGDHAKEARLASTMCKLIQDKQKAYRRYLAARDIGGEDWEVTNIFMQRALDFVPPSFK